MTAVLLVLMGYLIGSLSFAVLSARLFGLPDPRSFGSGNPGATNMLRTGRRLAAFTTLLGDAGKGAAAVLIGRWLDAEPLVLGLVGLAAFAGHLWPLFFGFRGGKGVATALGVLLALAPWLGLACLATWLLAFFMWRTSSLAALIAAVFAPMYAWAMPHLPGVYGPVTLLLSLLLLWRHRDNIRRLMAGEEGNFASDSRPMDRPPE